VRAELADAAHLAARLGAGSTRRLFALVLLLGTATTLVLSLDTTTVLLTPVVLTLTRQVKVATLPFAMATVWLANTASLLLPVSNLTNLLAMRRLGLSVTGFAAHMWLPALVALAVTVAVLTLRYRRLLSGQYDLQRFEPPRDKAAFFAGTAACLAVGSLFVAGFDVTIVSVSAASALALVFAVRDRSKLRFALLPWRLVLLVAGLFLVVRAEADHGLNHLLASAAGTSFGTGGLLRIASIGAGTSNLVNSLPAFAALQSVADTSVPRMLALLISTNLGPLILLRGSLATLLWGERCTAADVHIRAREFAIVGLIGVPLLLVGCTLALAVTT
jgi:arsenical pump membrane protein